MGPSRCSTSDWPRRSTRLASPAGAVIADVTSSGEPGIGMILGTAAYMSPEQARGKSRRQALRHLGVRLRALRDAHGSAPVRGSGRHRESSRASSSRSRTSMRCPRRLPRRFAACCSAAWRRIAQTASGYRRRAHRDRRCARGARRSVSDARPSRMDRRCCVGRQPHRWHRAVLALAADCIAVRSFARRSLSRASSTLRFSSLRSPSRPTARASCTGPSAVGRFASVSCTMRRARRSPAPKVLRLPSSLRTAAGSASSWARR